MDSYALVVNRNGFFLAVQIIDLSLSDNVLLGYVIRALYL